MDLFEWTTIDSDRAYVSAGANEAPIITCGICGWQNPDCRETLAIDPGMVQVCAHCWGDLPHIEE